MTNTTTPKSKQVQIVLIQVLAFNLLVTGLKIWIGLSSGILSIVADGFHSLVDGFSNVVGLMAIRISRLPPDSNHPYGHRKAETIASFFIGVLLLFVAFEILQSAVNRLFDGTITPIGPLEVGLMIITLIINLGVTTYESKRGEKLQSQILLADAEHTRSDIWVSLSVLLGLGGMYLGWFWLDGLISFIIAFIIAYSAFKIFNQTTHILMDQATLPQDEIEQLVLAMPQVESVERIRSRGQVDETYVDLHVRVNPDTPTDYAHSIAHAVQDQIKETYPQTTDVTVHIEPAWSTPPQHPDISRQLKAIAYSLGASAHEIWIHSIEQQYFVALHLEVPPSLNLLEAHDLATQLEIRGKQAIPKVKMITTHIEPMGETVEEGQLITHKNLLKEAKAIGDAVCGHSGCHNLHLLSETHHLTLSMHCTLSPDLSIVEAHDISQAIELAILQQISDLKRVVVHVEPPATKQLVEMLNKEMMG